MPLVGVDPCRIQRDLVKFFARSIDFPIEVQARVREPLLVVMDGAPGLVEAVKRVVTDGPSAETREQLGGYYLAEAGNLDEALSIAAKVLSARLGALEVWPVIEIPGPLPPESRLRGRFM
jgi:hypothetical protein